MIVYRCEDEKRNGPFGHGHTNVMGGGYHTTPDEQHFGKGRRYALRVDALVEKAHRKGWLYGHRDMSFIDRVFTPESRKAHGFTVSTINVTRYIEFPDGQVLFKDPRPPLDTAD